MVNLPYVGHTMSVKDQFPIAYEQIEKDVRKGLIPIWRVLDLKHNFDPKLTHVV